jgi:CheY-like chemotaxis protein
MPHSIETAFPASDEAAENPQPVRDLLPAHLRLLSTLNHEVRTPMTGILGMADLLLETNLSDEQRQYVHSTRQCAETLLESISNALEYSAVSSRPMELAESAFHLPEVLRSAVSGREPGARSFGVEIHAVIDEALPEVVVGDAFRLGQVVSLLLSHGVRASRMGEVHLVASACLESGATARLLLSVTDNGAQLSEEELANLFSPPAYGGYDQASAELGLPLAYEIVRQLGGTLTAESMPGEGTTITANLRFALMEAEKTPQAPDKDTDVAAKPRLLVVEDNEVAQRFMRTVLDRKGYQVTVAPSGEAALELAAAQEFDCVLMDIQMPGMDGFEATRRIRANQRGRRMPIIACTANTSQEVRAECADCGMDDFLAKPLQISELLDAVARNMARRQRASN